PTWNGAPSVFNEATYHVVNVSETGALPAHETDTAFSKVHYRAQPTTSPAKPTALPNLTVSYVGSDSSGFPSYIRVWARVGNNGKAPVAPGVPLALYSASPAAGGVLLAQAQTQSTLTPGAYEDVVFTWSNPP